MNYLFPVAFMANTFAMTLLMIILSLAGNSSMAAEVGIIQAATLALFYTFSANSRSLILNDNSNITASSVMALRFVLIVPIAVMAYFLSVSSTGIEQFFAIALILRRCVEWLNEVHLSEMERLNNKTFARNYLILQALLFPIVLASLLGNFSYPILGILIWALTPLVLNVSYILKTFTSIVAALGNITSNVLPHFGSTAIIGVTVYVFRLLIILILGKEAAGDMYAAFAIGGMTGGVFAAALGPSLALHEQRIGKPHFPSVLKISLYLVFAFGVVIFTSAVLIFPIFSWTGKSYFFWQATGLSLIGGVIMVHAQRIRFQLLQHNENHDIFGPDVMMNILLIAALPYIYYLLGQDAVGGLYLLSSVLALVFYWSSKRGEVPGQSLPIFIKIRMGIAITLLMPIFFQIGHGIFRDTAMDFNSGGVIANLPIPFSLLACYVGIVILGTYQRASVSLTTIFFACMLLTMTSIIVTQDNLVEKQAKLVLLMQFIIPMFALVLGQMYVSEKNGDNESYFEKGFLYVLAIVIPVQLICTWNQQLLCLTPTLGVFSIYQHLQYVPVIFVSAYLVALFSLWDLRIHRQLLLILAPMLAIYVVASISVLAILMLTIGFLGFAIFKLISTTEKLPAVLCLLVMTMTWSSIQYGQALFPDVCGFTNKLAPLQLTKSATPELDRIAPKNLTERIGIWNYYTKNIVTNPRVFLLGQATPPDRAKYTSAHNYYLDYIYNFGLIALVPIIALIAYTFILIYRYRREILFSPGLFGLCMVTLFLILVDNSLKVGLRQPYPGVFTFFLWGVLLSRLIDLSKSRESK